MQDMRERAGERERESERAREREGERERARGRGRERGRERASERESSQRSALRESRERSEREEETAVGPHPWAGYLVCHRYLSFFLSLLPPNPHSILLSHQPYYSTEPTWIPCSYLQHISAPTHTQTHTHRKRTKHHLCPVPPPHCCSSLRRPKLRHFPLHSWHRHRNRSSCLR